ncbi:MAG: hypothetical protein JO056_05215 [Alphaproteobacteria bacterium]|jgi:hypothetical protein|nr:hypothetical protein [Alphaproteobacteria bacterium]
MQFRLLIAALGGCLWLSACSENRLEKCPSVSVLVDTATLPVTAANGTDLQYTAFITKATRDCDIHRYEKELDASVNIEFRATRPNGSAAATYTVPYFVAITNEGRVLAKRQFAVRFTFEQGQTAAAFSDSVSSLGLTAGRDKQPFEYGIVVGFQLTKAQLDYVRRAGRYAK